MKLVKFSANWCANCKPLTKLMDGMDIPIEVQQVDVDKEPEISIQYNIMSIPTLIVFENGEIANKTIGACTKDEILDLLK